MVACLWCRIGCHFLPFNFVAALFLLVWPRFLLVGSAIHGVIGILQWSICVFSSFNVSINFGMRDICKVTGLLRWNMELVLRIRCRGLTLHMWLITAGGGGGERRGNIFLFHLFDAVLIYLYYRDIETIKIDLFLLVCNWWRWLLYCDSSYFYCGLEIYSFLA
jgi:hypothetical protein